MTAGPGSVTPPYLRPARLEEALAALAAEPRLVLAGGTDVYPAFTSRPIDRPVLDITGLEGLRGIAEAGDGWRIPALATWTDVGGAPLPPLFDGLRAAARTIGGRQIQNAGTVVGNVVNASPASDGMPNLLALDATVEIASARDSREMPLAAFVTGYRATDLRPGELVVGLRVPRPARGAARSSFRKLGSRTYLVISIVAVAAVVVVEEGVIREARVAIGACSPVATRLTALEAELAGRESTADLAALVRDEHVAGLSPIDDVRGTAAYRSDAVVTLVRRALAEVAG